MAKKTVKWGDRTIADLPPAPAGKRVSYHHPKLEGLLVRVTDRGTKTFYLYKRIGGRPQYWPIGTFPAWSAGAAFDAAKRRIQEIEKGYDPAAERQARKAAPTFAELAQQYIERHAKRTKRSWQTDQSFIDRFLLPAFGERKACDIARREVIALIEQIAEDTPVQANRVFACLRTIYSWAIRVDLVETTPCLLVRAPSREKPRDRVLTPDEIRQLWAVLDSVRPVGASRTKKAPPMTEGTALAIKLALVTGQRIGEITGLSWFEIDREGASWTLPATRSKNGLEHRVPLSKLALAILTRAAAIGGGSGYVFPGRDQTRHIDHNVIGHALRRAREASGLAAFTAHDLRRSAATRMASAGVPRVVLGKILNHKERGITAVYDRAGYDLEKREALEAWADELARLTGGAAAVEA